MRSVKWIGLAVVVLGLSVTVTGCGTTLLSSGFSNTPEVLVVPLNRTPTVNQRLTQSFGGGWCQVVNNRQVCYSGHLGEDYGAVVPGKIGDSVSAIRAGKVVITGDNRSSGFGVYVVIRHEYPGRPLYSIYGHLDSRTVRIGDQVAEGQQIGVMGTTGFSSAAHLHLGVLDQQKTGDGYRCNGCANLNSNFSGDIITHNGITYFKPSLFFRSPTLSIEGGISSTKPQGQIFNLTGSGYTPNGTVTRRIRKPDGIESTLTPTLRTNAAGNIGWSFTSSCATPVGTYILWAIDDTAGKGLNWSSEIYEIITRGLGCP